MGMLETFLPICRDRMMRINLFDELGQPFTPLKTKKMVVKMILVMVVAKDMFTDSIHP